MACIKRSHSLIVLSGFVLVGLGLAGCSRMHPIQNPLDVPLSGSRRTTMQMVAAAIDHAAVRRGWAVEHPEMGLAVLTLTKPKYRVQIELHYSATALSINYGGSEGLRYDGLQIHRNYNKWINALASDIRRRVLSSSNRM